jgi:hypothetical protein
VEAFFTKVPNYFHPRPHLVWSILGLEEKARTVQRFLGLSWITIGSWHRWGDCKDAFLEIYTVCAEVKKVVSDLRGCELQPFSPRFLPRGLRCWPSVLS